MPTIKKAIIAWDVEGPGSKTEKRKKRKERKGEEEGEENKDEGC